METFWFIRFRQIIIRNWKSGVSKLSFFKKKTIRLFQSCNRHWKLFNSVKNPLDGTNDIIEWHDIACHFVWANENVNKNRSRECYHSVLIWILSECQSTTTKLKDTNETHKWMNPTKSWRKIWSFLKHYSALTIVQTYTAYTHSTHEHIHFIHLKRLMWVWKQLIQFLSFQI